MQPRHIGLAILISFIWGINFVITKIGLNTFSPIFFACLRYTAIVFPLIFFIRRGGLAWKLIIQIGIFLGGLTFTLAFIGIELGVPAGLTSLVMQSQVVFTLLLSTWLLRDSPSRSQCIGIAIAFGGILLLVWDFHQAPSFIGLWFVLGGALCSGITKIVMKQGGDYDSFRLMVWMSLIPPIPLLLLSLIFESGQLHSLQNLTAAGVGAVVFNAFGSTVLGFGLSGYLIKLYSPNVVAPYALLVPVFGLASGYILLGETLNALSVLAAMLIMLGLVISSLWGVIMARGR